LKIGEVEHFGKYQEESYYSTIRNQQFAFSKNPSSSNKTRTADISACSGSRAA
jgi:hypothetical protein